MIQSIKRHFLLSQDIVILKKRSLLPQAQVTTTYEAEARHAAIFQIFFSFLLTCHRGPGATMKK